MFKWFSLSLFGFGAVTAYIIYNIFTITQLFITPSCSSTSSCFKSFLYDEPNLDLYLFSSLNNELKIQDYVKLTDSVKNFSYLNQWERKVSLEIPKSVRHNGTFYMHFFIVPSSSQTYVNWQKLREAENVVYFKVKLTQLHVPDSYIFNLLNKEKSQEEKTNQHKRKVQDFAKPITHLKSKITINMLTYPMMLPRSNIPQELYRYIKITEDQKFLPIVTYNFLETRLEDLKLMKNSTDEILLRYSPTYFGKFRFMVQLESTIVAMKKMGFSARDIDDIKSFFASTNFYLLCITIIISSFHLLFDFLAFKNDVKFWRNKSTMAGLSFRTVLWRAFSQAVILLYLLDEKASLIVLIPSSISTVIEFWKVMKIFRRKNSKDTLDLEKRTNEYDEESMRYLSFLLYPLCIIGAIYSLFYQPHKSWYSWCIHSLVNCVYAFGFLFMLPQLFINYRLKSVEALPWKAFMYKAFNTFIDDVFAFIITMPTAHRVACFRDDLIFLVYLYQRWLYPVDKTRVHESTEISSENDSAKKKKEN